MAAGIESRIGGPTSVVLAFSGPATGANVQASAGTVNAVTVEGSQATVQLSGVPDASCLTLTVIGVPGLPGATDVHFRCLAGDVTGDAAVNIFDLIATRNKLNQAVTAASFRSDVNADGNINIFDLIAIRNNLNHAAAGCP